MRRFFSASGTVGDLGRIHTHFPLEGFGEVALAGETQLFGHGADTLPVLQQLCGNVSLELENVFMDADAGVLFKQSFQAGFTDAAKAGDLGDGRLPVEITVEIADGIAEGDCIGTGGGRCDGTIL